MSQIHKTTFSTVHPHTLTTSLILQDSGRHLFIVIKSPKLTAKPVVCSLKLIKLKGGEMFPLYTGWRPRITNLKLDNKRNNISFFFELIYTLSISTEMQTGHTFQNSLLLSIFNHDLVEDFKSGLKPTSFVNTFYNPDDWYSFYD